VSEVGDEAEKFRCPRCGGSCYSSNSAKYVAGDGPPGTELIRDCRGSDGDIGCGFSWPDVDDHKYFETWRRIK